MIKINHQEIQPLVSFIVNCYNGGKYVRNCLNSIINQTYENWELIFWDNASTDDSKTIYNSFNDKRFKYFNSTNNVPLGQARFWAVNECIGDYICFLDVDDEWLPEKTAIQIKAMKNKDFVLCYGGFKEIIENTGRTRKILPRYSSGNIFKNNLCQFEINMVTAMIRKSSLIEMKLNFDPNIKASEEYCLFLQLIYNKSVCVIPQYLANYLVRNDSLTNMAMLCWADEREYTLNKLIMLHPEVQNVYKKSLNEAFARAEYYRARYYMHMDKRSMAITALKNIILINWKYLTLYLLLKINPSIWKKIINSYYKR